MMRALFLMAMLATPALAQDPVFEGVQGLIRDSDQQQDPTQPAPPTDEVLMQIVPGGDTGVRLETVSPQDDIATLENAPAKYSTATGGVLRMVDRTTGELTDLTMETNGTRTEGALTIGMGECRYPIANPASDAFAYVTVAQGETKLFAGWMTASSPALSAMDHRRYDVWVLRCITPAPDASDG